MKKLFWSLQKEEEKSIKNMETDVIGNYTHILKTRLHTPVEYPGRHT